MTPISKAVPYREGGEGRGHPSGAPSEARSMRWRDRRNVAAGPRRRALALRPDVLVAAREGMVAGDCLLEVSPRPALGVTRSPGRARGRHCRAGSLPRPDRALATATVDRSRRLGSDHHARQRDHHHHDREQLFHDRSLRGPYRRHRPSRRPCYLGCPSVGSVPAPHRAGSPKPLARWPPLPVLPDAWGAGSVSPIPPPFCLYAAGRGTDAHP